MLIWYLATWCREPQEKGLFCIHNSFGISRRMLLLPGRNMVNFMSMCASGGEEWSLGGWISFPKSCRVSSCLISLPKVHGMAWIFRRFRDVTKMPIWLHRCVWLVGHSHIRVIMNDAQFHFWSLSTIFGRSGHKRETFVYGISIFQ